MVTYENILFIQDGNADEIIQCFEEMSGTEFIEYVLDLVDPYGEAEFEQRNTKPWGSHDDVYTLKHDNETYFVSINWSIPYIGVCLRIDE